MPRTIIGISFFLVFSSLGSLYAQQKSGTTQQSVRDNINLNAFTVSSSRIMYGIPDSPGQLLGDIYLDTAFQVSTVYFYPEVVKKYDPKAADSISGYPFRLDLREHVVEFLVSNTIKGVEPRAIRKITYRTPSDEEVTLVNSREFSALPEKVFGFVQQLSQGAVEVYKFPKLNMRKPTYNAALSSGDKNAYYYQEGVYMFKNSNNALLEIKAKNKKALLDLLSKQRQAVETFMDKTGNNLKTDEDLIKVLAFYNNRLRS